MSIPVLWQRWCNVASASATWDAECSAVSSSVLLGHEMGWWRQLDGGAGKTVAPTSLQGPAPSPSVPSPQFAVHPKCSHSVDPLKQIQHQRLSSTSVTVFQPSQKLNHTIAKTSSQLNNFWTLVPGTDTLSFSGKQNTVLYYTPQHTQRIGSQSPADKNWKAITTNIF